MILIGNLHNFLFLSFKHKHEKILKGVYKVNPSYKSQKWKLFYFEHSWLANLW